MTSKPARKHHRPSTPRGAHALTGFLLLLLAIVLAYGNTLDAAWHLDDYHNIVRDASLHLREVTPDALKTSSFRLTDDGPALYRPVARLTFALNWYVNQSRVFGYHVVNILLHWMTAGLLFLTCRQLLSLPRSAFSGGAGRAYAAALAAALLWCLNPIQTQAVTYIVQRMTVMAAMFFLAALWLYIRGRQQRGIAAAGHFFGVVICFLLAVGSKENAVILPLTLLLVEVCFFQDLDSQRNRRRLWWASGMVLVLGAVVGITAYFILHQGNYTGFLEAYRERPFTLGQRLLTEPRVVLAYLGQIFFPAPWRLSVEHDITVSTSLWHPWTTLPAMLGIGALALAGLLQIRSRPLFAFAVLFFLINHSVESTFLPLELVFEHRNYLPSMFLFLPLAAGAAAWMRRHGGHGRLAPAAWVLVGCVLVLTAVWTHQRNAVWKSERSLWEDVLTKVPDSGRAHHNLAWGYYQKHRKYDQAIAHYRLALKFSDNRKPRQVGATHLNLGLLLMDRGEFAEAARHLAAATAARPEEVKPAYLHAVVLSAGGRLEQAEAILSRLRAKRPGNVQLLNLAALSAMRRARNAEAIPMLEKSLAVDPDNWQTHYYRGAAFSAAGAHRKAAHALARAHRLRPGEPLVWLQRIQNHHQAREVAAAADAVDALCGTAPLSIVEERVTAMSRGPFAAPLNTADVLALIRSRKAGATKEVPRT